jgi:hypothetical protein
MSDIMRNTLIIITMLILAVLPAGVLAAESPVANTHSGNGPAQNGMVPGQPALVTRLPDRLQDLGIYAQECKSGNCTFDELLNSCNISRDRVSDQCRNITANETRSLIREQIGPNISGYLSGNCSIGELRFGRNISTGQIPDRFTNMTIRELKDQIREKIGLYLPTCPECGQPGSLSVQEEARYYDGMLLPGSGSEITPPVLSPSRDGNRKPNQPEPGSDGYLPYI